jgi:hypothetical protein
MSTLLIIIIAGAVIVGAMLVITPLLNFVPTTDHYRGLVLLAVIFVAVGAIFGAYQGYGVVNGVIDGLLLFATVSVIGWLIGRIRRRATRQ